MWSAFSRRGGDRTVRPDHIDQKRTRRCGSPSPRRGPLEWIGDDAPGAETRHSAGRVGRLKSTLKSHSWPTPVYGRAVQGADIRAGFRHMAVAGLRQLVEQCPMIAKMGLKGDPPIGCDPTDRALTGGIHPEGELCVRRQGTIPPELEIEHMVEEV